MAKDKGKKKDDEKVEKKGKKSKPEPTVEKKGKKSKPEEAPSKKSKKGADEKSAKKSKGGESKGFAKPSEAPASGDGWNFTDEDHLGDLFLITPLRVDDIEDKFHPGERKEIVVADVVHLNEKKPEKSTSHEGVYVFQGYLKGSLRGYIGKDERVLGRLAKSDKKDRGNYPWILEDANKKDMEVAKAYVKFINNPLNAGKKSKSDDAKGGKKKAKK